MPAAVRQAGWEYGVGPAVHVGGRVDFAQRRLVRPDGGQYVAGSHTDGKHYSIEGDPADPSTAEKVSPQLDVVGWQTVDPNGIPHSGDETYFRNVTFDQSTLSGESADLGSSWGVSGQARRTFEQDHFFLSSLTLGLAVSRSEAAVSASNGRGISTETLTGILSRSGGTIPSYSEPRTPYTGATDYSMTDHLFQMGGARTTDVTVNLSAKTLLCSLRLGGQHDFALNRWLRLWVGAGPTVNLAMLTTKSQQQAVWQAVENPLHGTRVQGFSNATSESAFAVLPGAFGTVGLRLQIAEHLALDAGLTYDRILGQIETDQGSVDFGNSLGAEFRLIFDF